MGALGDYLTDGSGKTVYLYTPDTSSTSTCYTGCIAYWPPLLTTGAPKAGTGATASKLGTSPRTDGTTQVTYNGHPLYYYVGDKAPGDTSGQGKFNTWYLVTPAGTQIGAAASPSSAVKSGKY
jgi:predicted lipoprotein with Yx(FWY)xxD motif